MAPPHPMIDAICAHVYLDSDDTQIAIKRFESALAKYPGKMQLVYDYPEALMKAGRNAEAAAFAESQLLRFSNAGPLHLVAARAYAALDNQSMQHKPPAENFLIFDDHPLIIRALEQSLPHVDPRFDVIASTNREQTLTALARYPDCALVLLDLTLPGARGLDLLAELRLDYPYLPIVVLSATHGRATVGAALAAGARGYVSKTASPDALLDAIRTVLGGARGVTVDIEIGRASCRGRV